MINPEDLANTERLEQHRRSIAMLSTGAWALRREDALIVLSALVDQQLRAARQDGREEADAGQRARRQV